jgi:hypothetical protein
MFAALPRDRFYFTVLLAAGIHAVLLLGLSFNQAPQQITAAPIAIELKRGGDAITQKGLKSNQRRCQNPKAIRRNLSKRLRTKPISKHSSASAQHPSSP